MNASDMSATSSSIDAVGISREDLASVVAVYKRESKRLNSLDAFGMLGGVVVGVSLIGIGQLFGLADDWIPFFMLIMYATGATALGLEWVYRRRMVERIQIPCAFCHAPLISSGSPTRVASRAEIIVATGCCSSCGHSFAAREQPGDR